MPITLKFEHTLELGASFFSFVDKLKELQMPAYDDLKALIQAAIDAQSAGQATILAAVATEHDQVAAAIAEFEAMLANLTITPEQLDDLKAGLAAIGTASDPTATVAAVQAVYEPAPEA